VLKYSYIKSLLVVVILLLSASTHYAQSKTDSIIKANRACENIEQIDALYVALYGLDSISERLDYVNFGIEKSKQLDYTKGLMQMQYLKAATYNEIESYDDAILYFQNATKSAEMLQDSGYLRFCYMSIGSINLDIENYEQAKKEFFTGLKYANNSITKSVDIYNYLGTLYKELGVVDSSLYYHNKNLKLREIKNDTIGLAHSYNNIGLVYKHSGDFKTALQYLNKSLEFKKKVNDTKGIGGSYINIGSIYLLLKDYQKAYEYASLGMIYTDSVKAKTFTFNGSENALKALLKMQSERAYELFELYDSLNTELNGEEILNNIEANQIKFDVANKEQLLELEKAKANQLSQSLIVKEEKAKRLGFIIFAGIIGVIILIIFLIIVYKNFKKKKALSLSLEDKNLLIEQKNKDITDSINYAKKIQNSIMPDTNEFGNLFQDSLIYYKPKDIVSGDFYWFQHFNNSIVFAAADCTGHGVPGAMMSVICVGALNHFTKKTDITDPETVLHFIDKEVNRSTNGGSDEQRMADGMDIALCAYNKDNNTLQFSGANRPLVLIRNNEVVIYKGNKFPIGQDIGIEKDFTGEKIQLKKNDTVYVFTDGIVDQFGGEKGKKLLFKRLKEFLLSIQTLSFSDQKEKLDFYFNQWKGEEEQVDDVLLIGIKV
jgi:serine phosphatase RsbU (regulator of sigma subunit)